MKKNISKNFLLSIGIFSLLMMICLYSSLIPTVCAKNDVPRENAITVLNDVIGIDLTKYSINEKEAPSHTYRGSVVEKNIRFNLESNGSKIDVIYTFADDNLRIIDVLEIENFPIMKKTTNNVLEMARNFLINYQNYSKKSVYDQFESMLNVVENDKNSTTKSGNIKLEVTTWKDSTTFRWTYTVNGVDATSKCVVLGYRNGFLKYFINNWDLYKIGSTDLNLSEDEAIKIGIDSAKSFSWEVASGNQTIEIKEFNVTQAMIWRTGFCSSLDADEPRSDYPFTLYPIQHVWVSLDKFYPGNVYGIEVVLWADTKEICYVKERFSTLDVPTEPVADIITENEKNSVPDSVKQNSPSVDVSVVSIAAFFISVAIVFRFKSYLPTHFTKIGSSRVNCVLFCLLFSTMLLLAPISIAFADNYTGRSTIWGSESVGGSTEPEYPYNTRKLPSEIRTQQDTAVNITNMFNDNGYEASNYQGDGSLKEWILANISHNEANYRRVAVVDFDHGVGRNDSTGAPGTYGEFHYMFEDNIGKNESDPSESWIDDNMVYDYEIFDETTAGNTFFAFINTCKSADISDQMGDWILVPGGGHYSGTNNPVGMPYAWTHRKVEIPTPPDAAVDTTYNMTAYGYQYPDNGKFCYIGYPHGSASLSQNIDGVNPKHFEWVESFFNYSLKHDMTIVQALDHASYEHYSSPLNQTKLFTGFHALWLVCRYDEEIPAWVWYDPDPFGGDSSKLVVYGNGNLKLYQPLLKVDAKDSSGSPLAVAVEIDGESVGTTSVSERVFATFSGETHSIEVTEPNDYYLVNITDGTNTYTSTNINIPIESDLNLTAYFAQDPPPPVAVTFVIDSTAVGDSYTRYHAFTVDNSIPHTFWTGDWYNQNPDAIIAITGTSLHYETTRYLTEGYHNIEYAVSSYVGYWSVTITANGQQVITSQSTTAYNHVTTQIYASNDPPPMYTLTITYNGEGGYTIPAEGQHQYSSGTQVEVTAYDSGGNYFANWTLDGQTETDNPITVNMNTNRNLQANFDPNIMYNLDIDISGQGYTNPAEGLHQYSSGTQVQVTAYDQYYQYWYFTGWTLDGNPNGNNPITVPMTSNHNLVANYYYDEPPPPPPSYDVTLEIWGYYPPWTRLYQGTAPMEEGPHQVTASLTYGGFSFYAWCIDENYYYNPTIWIYVYSDMTIYALYTP